MSFIARLPFSLMCPPFPLWPIRTLQAVLSPLSHFPSSHRSILPTNTQRVVPRTFSSIWVQILSRAYRRTVWPIF